MMVIYQRNQNVSHTHRPGISCSLIRNLNQIIVNLKQRVFCDSKLFGLRPFDNITILLI